MGEQRCINYPILIGCKKTNTHCNVLELRSEIKSSKRIWKFKIISKKFSVSIVLFFLDMFVISAKLHDSRRVGQIIWLKEWGVYTIPKQHWPSREEKSAEVISPLSRQMPSAFPSWHKSLSFTSLLLLFLHLFISPSFPFSLSFFLLVSLVNLSFAVSWGWEVTKRGIN